jgi:hypothetical protein
MIAEGTVGAATCLLCYPFPYVIGVIILQSCRTLLNLVNSDLVALRRL